MAPAPNLTSSIHSLKHTHTHWGLEIACWWWKKVLNIKTELVVLMENDMPPFSHPQPPQPPSPFLLFTDLYRQSFCSCTFSSVQHSGITGWICWFWWIIHFIFYSNCYSSYAVKVKYCTAAFTRHQSCPEARCFHCVDYSTIHSLASTSIHLDLGMNWWNSGGVKVIVTSHSLSSNMRHKQLSHWWAGYILVMKSQRSPHICSTGNAMSQQDLEGHSSHLEQISDELITADWTNMHANWW